MSTPQTVTMGGGTGTFAVISALKKLPVKISTVIAVSDSGGSTGRIRDEFGFPPVGDLRQSLAALAEPESQEWIRKILLYRFDKGEGLRGHNLGNLILTALQDMTEGDTTRALEIAESVFDLQGKVIPVTAENVELVIYYANGTKVVGEHILDETGDNPKKVARIELTPAATLNSVAADALAKANLIIIGPGDYYASLMATLVVEGISEVFAKTQAKIVYITNLMTRRTQTHGMTAADHLRGIENQIGREVDRILINNEFIPEEIINAYAAEDEYPVVDDLTSDERVLRLPLIRTTIVQKAAEDTAYRSLLRHDEDKLRAALQQLLSEIKESHGNS